MLTWDSLKNGPAGDGCVYTPPQFTSKMLRNFYVFCRRVYIDPHYADYENVYLDGGYDSRLQRSISNPWPGVLAFINLHAADPLLYIAYSFLNNPHLTITPLQLKSPKMLASYQLTRSQAEIEAQRELKFGLDSIDFLFLLIQQELEWEPERAMQYALLDKLQVQATKLVRLNAAFHLNLVTVQQLTWQAGLIRYILNLPVYLKVWRSKLHPAIVSAGNDWLNLILRGENPCHQETAASRPED